MESKQIHHSHLNPIFKNIFFYRICVDTGRGCGLLFSSPLAASQNFEVGSLWPAWIRAILIILTVQNVQHSRQASGGWFRLDIACARHPDLIPHPVERVRIYKRPSRCLQRIQVSSIVERFQWKGASRFLLQG